MKSIAFRTHATLVGLIVLTAVVATIRAPVFASWGNIIELLRSTSTTLIAVCPLALLAIGRGIDFSTGAAFSLGAVLAGEGMVHGAPWPFAVVLGLGGAAFMGLSSGALVVFGRTPSMVATLAAAFVATGIVSVTSKGLIAPLPDSFLTIGQAEVLGIPVLVIFALAVFLASWMLLERTPFGYALRATGGNNAAAYAAGINTTRTTLTVYALSAVGSATAGILYSARTSAVQPDAGGLTFTLQILTAVLVGGVSLAGGVGRIGGAVLGTVFLNEVTNALGVVDLNQAWSNVVIGVLLVTAVGIDGYRRGTANRFGGSKIGPSVVRQELPRIITTAEEQSAAREQAAIERERERLKRDLHDGAQQRLVTAALMVQLATDQLGGEASEQVSALLSRSKETVQSALAELRDLSHGNAPAALASGLQASLQQLASNAPLRVDVHCKPTRYRDDVEAAVYYVVAEALTNTAKHAQASKVSIRIVDEPDEMRLEIRDDGRGGAEVNLLGRGLAGLQQRVQELGGRLTVQSPRGLGTTIVATFPDPKTVTDRSPVV